MEGAGEGARQRVWGVCTLLRGCVWARCGRRLHPSDASADTDLPYNFR